MMAIDDETGTAPCALFRERKDAVGRRVITIVSRKAFDTRKQ
jgi:hypothetical protein